MINKIFIVFFCTILNQSTQGQSNVTECFDCINEAEQFILECDFDGACSSYEKAFTSKKCKPFFVDILTALKCNLLSTDTIFKKVFLEKLSKKNISYVDLISEFKDYELSDSNKKQLKESCKPKINTLSTQFLQKLIENDQLVRSGKVKITAKERNTRDSVDLVNFYQFKGFIEENAFPSEENTSYKIGDHKYSDVLNILLRHFTQIGKLTLIQAQLKSAVVNLNLHPSIYANMIQLNNENPNYPKLEPLYNSFVLSVGKNQYYKLTDDLNFDEINKLRSEIGLDSLHVSQRKFICINMNFFTSNIKLRSLALEPYLNIDVLPAFLFENNPIMNRRINDYDFRKKMCPCLDD